MPLILTKAEFDTLSEVDLVCIILISRRPYSWETWKEGSLREVRWAVLQLPEFPFCRSSSADLVNPVVDVALPADIECLARCFRVLIAREPSVEETEYYLQTMEIRASKLVADLVLSLEARTADRLLAPGNTKEALHISRVKIAAYGQFDAYAESVLRRSQIDQPALLKLRSLATSRITVGLNMFAISDADLSHISREIKEELGTIVEFRRLSSAQVLQEGIDEFDVYLTNNNYLENHVAQFEKLTRSRALTICWHWDNHHQFDMTCQLIHAFDVVYPAHSMSQITLHGAKCIAASPMPCSVIQWSTDEATSFSSNCQGRKDALYGSFNSYPGRVHLRDFFLEKCSRLPFADISVVPTGENKWFLATAKERFDKLSSAKVVICNPIYNDVPARLFDALLAGCCPVIPYGLPDLELSFSSTEQQYLGIYMYVPDNITSLEKAYLSALRHFDSAGQQGTQRRTQFILSGHMLWHRIRRILRDVIRLSSVA